MTLRPETVRERLALARASLEALTDLARVPRKAFLGNRRDQWAAAYGLQSTAQSLLDAAAHVLSGHFKEAPREYGEIVPRLTERGVLDRDLGDRLAKVSGFRNVLVHEYSAVDFALVHDKLQQLEDLRAFAAALERWLTAQNL